MNPFITIGLQSTLSIVIFSMLSVHYLIPKLRGLNQRSAVVPLLWINSFRYLPLILFAPGQVSDKISHNLASVIAYGDLISGLLALVAVIIIIYRLPGAILMTWLFLIIGTIDSVNGIYSAISAEAYLFPLGVSWS